ncbi:MAG: phage/plasmid primase, P4 family [Vicinamibacterales bacterium]|nr:phage/plasmid primase, P4 family [Vicinamibacterales bacterium]
MAVDRVCSKLQGLKHTGTGWTGRCPAHDDQHNSLSINEGSDGKALVHCHAGCAPSAILSSLGLTLTDLFPPEEDFPSAKTPTIYEYRNVAGELVYQACRFPPKDFRQRRPDGKGGWLWNLTGVKRIPYRLPELQGVATVALVEGEKDANRLWSLGIPATTNSGGAGKWGAAETKALKEAGCQRAVVIPDNDSAGRKHGEDVAKRCKAAGMAVSLVELPNLSSHGDVSDWLDAGHTKDELIEQMSKLYVVPPTGAVPPAVPVDDAPDDETAKPTEAAFAQRFAAQYGGEFKYDVRRKVWLHYQTPRWRVDPGKTVRRKALSFVRQRQAEALASTDYEMRAKQLKFALQAESKNGLDHVVSMAEWQPEMMDLGNQWDHDPWLLGVPNGVVDLRTGKLRAGDPADRLTMICGVPYDPNAACPRWWQFLSEVFEDDVDIVDFVFQLCGYMLTGRTTEQILIICYGPGANGKSRFLGALKAVFGDYAATLPFSSIVQTGNETVSNDLAALEGRRLVVASEINEGVRLNEARLKSLTGEDAISARFLYGEHFTFTPVAKFIFGVNHKPVVKDDSHGFWRRVRLLPFMRKFEGAANDPMLAEKLLAEGPGILAWAVQGCLAWQAGKLPLPSAIKDATAEYEADSDQLSEFLAAFCEQDPEESVAAAELYRAYVTWCDQGKLAKWDRLSANGFGRLAGSRFKKKQTAGGALYLGLHVKSGKLSWQK